MTPKARSLANASRSLTSSAVKASTSAEYIVMTPKVSPRWSLRGRAMVER